MGARPFRKPGRAGRGGADGIRHAGGTYVGHLSSQRGAVAWRRIDLEDDAFARPWTGDAWGLSVSESVWNHGRHGKHGRGPQGAWRVLSLRGSGGSVMGPRKTRKGAESAASPSASLRGLPRFSACRGAASRLWGAGRLPCLPCFPWFEDGGIGALRAVHGCARRRTDKGRRRPPCGSVCIRGPNFGWWRAGAVSWSWPRGCGGGPGRPGARPRGRTEDRVGVRGGSVRGGRPLGLRPR